MYRNRREQRPAGSNFLRQPGRTSKRYTPPKAVGSILVVVAIACVVSLVLHFSKKTSPTADSNKQQATDQSVTDTTNPTAIQGFDKSQYSTTDPGSIWVVVNKKHSLSPKTYIPKDLVVPDVPLRSNITGDERQLRAEPAKALENMVRDAANDGVHLNLQSGYRSYNLQVSLYNGYVNQQGRAAADRTSARPGYSEHQTGLAVDVGGTSQPLCNVAQCFANTPEGKWVAAHAYTYGFIIRYTEDKEPVTGYDHEPWHLRYIGAKLASELHTQHIETLEEFFDITGGTTY